MHKKQDLGCLTEVQDLPKQSRPYNLSMVYGANGLEGAQGNARHDILQHPKLTFGREDSGSSMMWAWPVPSGGPLH
jgi:hypothetical protein